MFRKIEDNHVIVGNSKINYLSFGRGTEPLVIIPGLGDGLRTVKGMGLIMARIYHNYARTYRVWLLSRKDKLEPGTTTRAMAADQAEAMAQLGLNKAAVLGISQGGMIAQWLASDHPHMVKQLILAITLARHNETLRQAVGYWIELAEAREFGELAIDTMEKNYTESYLRRWRPFYWFVRMTGRPAEQSRFLIQAQSCLTHDAYRQLGRITSPTLVIGGGADQIVGGLEVQEELAAAIERSIIKVYPEYGHGVYAEAKDFDQQILSFLENNRHFAG